MNRLSPRRGVRLALALLIVLLGGSAARAATFDVNSTADILNPPSGTVTLRSAIQAANTAGGTHTINLTVPGTYTITLIGTSGQADNQAGEFAINTGVTIANTSGGTVVVDARGRGRVFDINPASNPTFLVTLQGFTVTNGVPSDVGNGANIRVRNADLTMNNMTVTNGNNRDYDYGGGVYARDCTLHVSDSTISNNASYYGGGFYLDDNTTTTMVNTTVASNECNYQGGGINANASTAALTLTNCTVSSNFATSDYGGGVYANGPTLTVQGCTFASNKCGNDEYGGGLYTDNSSLVLTVQNSTFENNVGEYGAISFYSGDTATIQNTSIINNSVYFDGPGGLYLDGNGHTVQNCTISRNSGGDNGGVVVNSGTTTTIQGCTIADNRAFYDAGGISIQGSGTGASASSISNCTITGNQGQYGGGIYWNGSGELNVVSCTVNGNSTAPISGNGGQGGGLYRASGTVSVQNTICAGNAAASAADGPDAFGTFTDLGGNFIGARDGSNFVTTVNTQTGTAAAPIDPLLSALADNGGPTFTEALKPGSPCIDKALVALATDQRGVPRPQGGVPDVGAFELNSGPTPIVALSTTSLDFGLVGLGGTKTLTVTLTNTGSGNLTVSSVAGSGDFSTTPLTNPVTVAGGASASLTVSFQPTATGARRGTLTINDDNYNAPNSRQVVTLLGSGSPQAALVPASGTTPQSALVSTAFAKPLSVTVTNTGGQPVAGVNVTFTAPGSGATGTFAGGASTFSGVSDATGVVTAPTFTANATQGTYFVTATSPGLATAFTMTNTVPNFTVTASSTAQTITAGGTASYTITITPENGYNLPVTFGVSGLPAGATATFNPPTATPNGGPVSTVLTITTTAQTAARATALAGLPLLALFLLFARTDLRRRAAMFVLAAFVVGGLAGCGGGGDSNSSFNLPVGTTTPSSSATVTPAGTSQLVVTASGPNGQVVNPITLNLTVK